MAQKMQKKYIQMLIIVENLTQSRRYLDIAYGKEKFYINYEL
ncbi:MAG: hypothetical protein HPY66_2181 [Firmicutes bacterium]|nr:hypothetical protein [Bacillota bacterium]